MGKFFVDMWRVVIYIFLPVSFALALIFLQQGAPMTFASAPSVSTLEPAAMGTADNGQAKQQSIVVGPLAAFVPMEQLGTNGGGFYGMNFSPSIPEPDRPNQFPVLLRDDGLSVFTGADVWADVETDYDISGDLFR